MKRNKWIYPLCAIVCIIAAVTMSLVWNGNDMTMGRKLLFFADVVLAVFFVIKDRRER